MKKQIYNPFIFLLIGVVIFILLELFPQLFYSTSFNIQTFNTVLHQKETKAAKNLDILIKQDNFSRFSNLESFKELSNQGVYFFIYKNQDLRFWTSSTVPINSLTSFNDNVGVIHLKNGWYQYLKKERGAENYLALILIKHEYSISNHFLSPSFHKSFNLHDDIELIFDQEPGFQSIKSLSGKFLFALKEHQFNYKSSNWVMVTLFLIGYVALIIFIHLFFKHTLKFKKGGYLIGALYIVASYLICTFTSFPTPLYQQKIFSPNIYAHSAILPSLGNLLLATVAFFAFTISLVKFSKSIRKSQKIFAVAYMVLSSIMSIIVCNWFIGIIKNSNINFDVNFLLDLSAYSFLGIFIVITLFISLVILIKATIDNFSRQAFKLNQLLPVYWCIGILSIIIGYFSFNIDWLLSSWFLLIILLFSFPKSAKPRFYQGAILLIVLSLCLSYGFIHYSIEKNDLNDMFLLKKLSKEQDPVTEYLFKDVQLKIEKDTFLTKQTPNYWDKKEDIDKYIKTKYFNGYWSKYDVNIYLCQPNDTLLIEPENIEKGCIEFFTDKIETESVAAFDNNDHINFLYTDEGVSSYLGIATIDHPDTLPSSLFIELIPKILSNTEGYPELLLNKKELDVSVNLNNYSFAKYKKNNLTTHLGSFNYNTLLNANLKFNENDFATLIYGNNEHLFYQSNKNTVVVLSSPQKSIFNYITTFSYFFLIIGISSLIVGLIFKIAPFNWQIATTNFGTKVQLFVIVSTFISFILFGLGTSYYIKKQYVEKNTKAIQEKVQSVLVELESNLGNESKITPALKDYIGFKLVKFSNIFYTDINLYDTTGLLISTSRPEVIDQGLISNIMDPHAFNTIHFQKKSSLIHEENINKLNYLSAYVPFRNNKNEVFVYLNLPYFAKQNELEKELSSFFTALINSYALLFLISVIIAIVFANYISEPVRLIKEKIGALQFGKTNELIEWQSNDEIGALVKEYNQKVLELENSADLLAKSERESAWREMAKQVAHEIKNPLTPMKLSIQHLERSIADQPDDINERIKRTAKTLIDQIDTLTNIANEFSNFAKMPKAKQQQIDLIEIIETSIDLYQDKNVTFKFKNQCNGKMEVLADKDQMNRVLSNLIKNAIQAIPEDTEGIIEINTSTTDSTFIVEITDNGNGIPEEKQSQIFEPNFTTKTNGMGLGLAMVKNIIENADGTISFTTQENVGTSFFIELPQIE